MPCCLILAVRSMEMAFIGETEHTGSSSRYIQRLTEKTFDRVDRAAVDRLIDSGRAPKLTLRETMDVIATGTYEGLGLDPGIKDRYVDLFCEGAKECLDRNRRWLATLREQYRLGVISNNFGNTQGWCNEYSLSPLLDVVIDSTVVGISKPEAGIFHTALSGLGVSPEEAIYVGDTYSDDVVGAKGVGMWAAWLVGAEDKECPDASLVDIQLRDIQGLMGFLESENRTSGN